MINSSNLKMAAIVVAIGVLGACMKDASDSTGWNYNDPKTGGFEKAPHDEQETGPGLTLVEGGTFTMGRAEQDVMFDWNARPTRVTVSSFYMDITEVTNFHWLEYMYWISRAYREYPQVLQNAMPDTLCWRSPLAYNEKYVDFYLRHPSYRDYPVVGVSWIQANDFCRWRTDRVNEYVLIREGIIDWDTKLQNDSTFNTDAYYNGRFKPVDTLSTTMADDKRKEASKSYRAKKKAGKIHKGVPNLNPDVEGTARINRYVKIEDGILLPPYRLPTEAEWEFAAAGLIGNMIADEAIDERRIYPWDGHYVRNPDAKFSGDLQANFVRGRGDYMGVAGHLNDGADVTAPVTSFWPNDYGLYHMAGNVSEWVLDTYRPLSSEDFDEFRPFRGNVFKTKRYSSEGIVDKNRDENGYGATEYDVHGMKEYLNEFERIRYQRVSAQTHDPNDPKVTQGTSKQVLSRNPVNQGNPPTDAYLARGKKKDSVELDMIKRINIVLDSAIFLKNSGYDIEANRLVRDNIYGAPELSAQDVYEVDWSGNNGATPTTNILGANTLILESTPSTSQKRVLHGKTIDGRPPLFYEYRSFAGQPDPTKKVTDPATTGFYAYGYEVIEMLKEGFSQFITDTPGKLKYREVTEEENIGRLNYKKSDYRDYLDGDIESSIFYNNKDRKGAINNGVRDQDMVMYQSEHEEYNLEGGQISQPSSSWPATLVSNRSKVYKGGSWRDRVYWLAVGNRRFLDEDKSNCTIGFRCCMDRVGSPVGMNFTPKKRRRR
jgi:gliding motility-associated lipoprotein GldJ